MRRTVSAMHRSLPALGTSLLAALSLAACTSNTQKCSNGTCEIDLSGAGASTELGGDGGSTIELISASGKTAKVKIAGQEGELTVGQPVTLDNATLVLEEIEGEDDVQLKLTGSSAADTAAEEDDDSKKKKKK